MKTLNRLVLLRMARRFLLVTSRRLVDVRANARSFAISHPVTNLEFSLCKNRVTKEFAHFFSKENELAKNCFQHIHTHIQIYAQFSPQGLSKNLFPSGICFRFHDLILIFKWRFLFACLRHGNFLKLTHVCNFYVLVF